MVLEGVAPDNVPMVSDDIVAVFEGGLNFSTVHRLPDAPGEDYVVVRIPKSPADRAVIQSAITEEYAAVGAADHGVGFNLRTPAEQRTFMNHAKALGLKTLECTVLLEDQMATDFVNGVSLDKYLGRDPESIDPQVIHGVLSHLTYAHTAGVVFGDRWVKNTLVMPEGDFTEIDFDIQLRGELSVTSTFELAQTMYHLLHFADRNRTLIAGIIANHYVNNPQLLKAYDPSKFNDFMHGQARYFYGQYLSDGALYEGIVPPYEVVFALTDTLGDSWQRAEDQQETSPAAVFEPGRSEISGLEG